MLKTFGIAVTAVFALAASGCEMMSGMMRGDTSASTQEYMGGSAPVTSDPAGNATSGSGSVSWTGKDRRIENATGMGAD